MDKQDSREAIEEQSQARAYRAAVFGHCARMGIALTTANKAALEALIQQANDKGLSPDRVAQIIGG